MAKIKVGSGFGKTTLAAALQRCAPGDLLILDPGRYHLDPLALSGIGLHGNGAVDQIEIVGSFTVTGHCTFTNLTLRALPYKNAIYVQSAQNMATLTSCVVFAEPGDKYPALWCGGGTLVLNHVVCRSESEQEAAYVTDEGTLHATASQLACTGVNGAKADLIDSTTSFLDAMNGARVSTFGSHRCISRPGKRVFRVSGRSVCSFANLVLGETYEEGIATDSIVQIDSVVQAPGGSFTVVTAEDARVKAPAGAVTVVDQDAPPVPPAGPKTIRWGIEDAHDFTATIVPQVGPGDTIILDAGDYTLDDNEPLRLGANLTGQGRDRTRIHGTIGAMAGGEAVVSGVTICAPSIDRNAVLADQADGRLTLDEVALQSREGAKLATLYADAGTVVLRSCDVGPLADRQDLRGRVILSGRAEFEAQHSDLGWFYASDAATASLSACVSYQLAATSGANITVGDEHHILANECDQYELWAEGGGTLDLRAVTTTSDDLCARIDGGSLGIREFGSMDDATFSVYMSGGDVHGIDPGAYTLYETDQSGEFALVREATRGRIAHGQGGESAEQPLVGAPSIDSASVREHEGSSSEVGAEARDPLAELHELVGLVKVKEQVQGFVNAVKLRAKRAELGLPVDDEFTLHSMFLGNPGTGKTTVARLIGRAMHAAGVVENERFVEAGRAQLVSENIGGTAKQTRAVLESGRGGVIFIDEAYALASEDSAGFAAEAVTEILTFMENHRSDTMVILAGYNDKMHELLAVNDGLKSRIKHRFDFEDYSGREIADIGLSELARGQYTVNEELYRRVIGAAYARSADASNARWVRNFNQDLRAAQGERVIRLEDPTRDDLTAILDTDLHMLAGGDPESRETRLAQKLAELDALTGLAPVKAWARSLVDQATVNQRMIEIDGSMERPNYHVAFTGNPGTGKTTVARILAEIFHALGILATPTVQSVAASQLIGRYVGHSSDNTHRAFDAAMGGVLFVDEAHQLRSTAGQNSAFQQEVVDSMITRLEDDRDKFVAIFAGYTAQMHEFFDSDPGLRSRIPAEIEFPDYTPAEVAEIATAILAKKWRFDAELFAQVAASAYEALPTAERSNGRWARTFAEAVVARHNSYLLAHDVRGDEMKQIPDEVLHAFAF